MSYPELLLPGRWVVEASVCLLSSLLELCLSRQMRPGLRPVLCFCILSLSPLPTLSIQSGSFLVPVTVTLLHCLGDISHGVFTLIAKICSFSFFFNRIYSCTPHLFSVESSHPFSPKCWRLLVGLVLHRISMYFIIFSFIHSFIFLGRQEAIFGSPAIVLFKIHVLAPQD